MEGKTEGKTIQELLKKATEEEYFEPIMEEYHERALEFLRTLGIADSAFSSTSGYYNRKESALRSELEWMVGKSMLRAEALLVTEVLTEKDYLNKWENLGLDGLKNADPLTRILERAFRELSYNIDIALLDKLGVKKDIYIYGTVSPGPLSAWYVKPIDAGKGFLRIIISNEVIIPIVGFQKIIFTYLRFYKNSLPKPHGTGKDSIAL